MDQLPVFRSVYLLFNLIIFPSSPILFWIFPTSHFFLSFASLWEENYEFAGQFWILATGLKVCGRKLLEESSSEPASQNFFKLSFSNYLLSRPPRTLAFIQFSHIQRLHRIRLLQKKYFDVSFDQTTWSDYPHVPIKPKVDPSAKKHNRFIHQILRCFVLNWWIVESPHFFVLKLPVLKILGLC